MNLSVLSHSSNGVGERTVGQEGVDANFDCNGKNVARMVEVCCGATLFIYVAAQEMLRKAV